MDKKQELQSLKRGLRTVTLINTLGSVTIAVLARRLQVPRTTAERLLMTLLAEGYLERDSETKAFFLTGQVQALARGYMDENRLVALARPAMEAMTREIGWPLCLATPLGESMSIQITTDAQTTLNLNRRYVGSAGPMALVSSGIVFLAFLDPVQRALMLDILSKSEDSRQAAARDLTRLDYALEQARRDGFSFGFSYGPERSVAVPIIIDGQVKAALLLVFMARVLPNEVVVEKFMPRLKAIAQDLARQIEAEGPWH